MKTYETATSFEATNEHEKTQEQSPEEFVNSLKIFDAYVDVTPDMAEKPEYQMTFDKEEQQLAEGLRSMLENIAAEALDDDKSVSINEMFDSLDGAILASKEAVNEDIRDQLLLVATKMRFNLQVRFNKGSEEVSTDSAGASMSVNPHLNDSFIKSYAEMGSIFRGHSRYVNKNHERPLGDYVSDDTKFDKPQPESPKERNYYREAQVLLDKETGGANFKDLTPKEQGRVRRKLASKNHPDAGGDENLYKEIGNLTADDRKNSS